MQRMTLPLPAERPGFSSLVSWPASNGSFPLSIIVSARLVVIPMPRPSTFIHFTQQQGHRGIVVIRRVFGRRGKVEHAVRERLADGFGRPQMLGGNAQLIAGDKTQQRTPGARNELWVALHWAKS